MDFKKNSLIVLWRRGLKEVIKFDHVELGYSCFHNSLGLTQLLGSAGLYGFM